MERSQIIGRILVALGIIGIIAFVYFSFFYTPREKEAQGVTNNSEVPFPNPGFPVIDPVDPQEGVITEPEEEDPTKNILDILKPRTLLYQLSDEPAGGFTFKNETREVLVEEAILVDTEDETTGESTQGTLLQDIKKEILIHQVGYSELDSGALHTIDLYKEISDTTLSGVVVPFAAETKSSKDLSLYRYTNDEGSIETLLATLDKNIITATCSYAFTERLVGDEGEDPRALERVQTTLTDIISRLTSQVLPTPKPGVFDKETETLIRAFQKAYNIEQDGNVGSITNAKLQEICSYYAQKDAEQVAQSDPDYRPFSLSTSFLESDILETAAVSDEVFVYGKVREDNSAFMVSQFNTQSKETKLLFEHPFLEWILSSPRDTDQIFMQTKSSGTADSILYELDTEKRSLEKVIGPFKGLTSLVSPDGNIVLYSSTSNEGSVINLFVYNRLKNTTKPLSKLTFAEKCVWSNDNVTIYCAVPTNIPRGLYPDEWYMGVVNFTDGLWSINTETGKSRLIDSFRAINNGPDIIFPQIDETETWFGFIDDNSKLLWGRVINTKNSLLD